MEFRHPKYYKELEKIRKEFEDEQKQKASSNKRQAASHKLQVSGTKADQQAERRTDAQAVQETVPYNDIEEAQAARQPEPDITEDSWSLVHS